MSEPESYQDKKAFFDRVLTIYGRNAVLEALGDNSLECYCVHLASSNREAGSVAKITALADKRGLQIKHHTRAELARISKSGKQDQGVALDIICPGFRAFDNFLNDLPAGKPVRLLALDGITNPQNLGMIVRSAAAGRIDGILWSSRGNAALGPLVIKASAGTLYRAPMLVCSDLVTALSACRDIGMAICTLEATASESLFTRRESVQSVFVLGNESEGVSDAVKQVSTVSLSIPMNNSVESLNVAVTASLIAYAGNLRDSST